ncbi:MAG: nucleoside triphosphate pyrophosphatase [Parasphingorhabdus sp.]
MMASVLILASESRARKKMLESAGVVLKALAPNVDEDALRAGLNAGGVTARKLAVALAEAKAVRLSARTGGALVLGGDQVLALEDGTMLSKPVDKSEAKAHLVRMSGSKHKLFSAAVIAEAGSEVWRHIGVATMTMRDLSEEFIDHYVENEWDEIRYCVGCYEIEGRGAQLFSDIEGSQFTIMGLPMLEILEYLRERGLIPS